MGKGGRQASSFYAGILTDYREEPGRMTKKDPLRLRFTPMIQVLKTGGGKNLNNIWMRAGVTLQATAEKIETLMSDRYDAAHDTLCRILREGRFFFDGNSYIPETAVQDYIEKYGASFEVEEPEFELLLLPDGGQEMNL